MTDDTLRRTMLLDFYGELLTAKQREYFDLHFNEDLSLSEIAEQSGISRQGVWDIIRRAEQSLLQTEEKTGLVKKAMERRQALREIAASLRMLLNSPDEKARALAGEAIEKLNALED